MVNYRQIKFYLRENSDEENYNLTNYNSQGIKKINFK